MVFGTKTLLCLSVFLSACSTTPRPLVDVKFWYGDSGKQSLTRQVWQSPVDSISCKSSKFDNYIAMSSEDFSNFFKLFVLGCEKWKKSGFEMTEEEKLLLEQVVKGE